MYRIIVIASILVLLYTSIATADMREIESIRKEVGEKALIIMVPHYNCSHIYIVKKEDGSVWTYFSTIGFKQQPIIRKALIFKPDKDVHH